jgi:hypothetical protein
MADKIVKGRIGEQDFNRYVGRDTTFTRPSSTGGTTTLNRIGYEVDVLVSFGSGTQYTSNSISTAIQAIGSNNCDLILRPGSWTITGTLTIPSNCRLVIPRGALFVKGASGAIVFNSELKCGIYQIFSGFSSGDITFAAGSVKKLYAEWWGAVGNGVTDDAAALNTAWVATGTARGTLILLGKTYRFDSQLAWNTGYGSVRGPGNEMCVLLKHGNFTGILFSGGGYNSFQGFSVTGDTGNGGIGGQVTNGDSINMRDIKFLNHASHGLQILRSQIGYYDNLLCQGNGGSGLHLYDQYNHGAGPDAVNANTFHHMNLIGNTAYGLNLASCGWNVFSGQTCIQNNTTGAVYADYSKQDHILALYMEGNGSQITGTANSYYGNFNIIQYQSVPYFQDAGSHNHFHSGDAFRPDGISRNIPSTNIAGYNLNISAGMAGAGTTGHGGGTLGLYGGDAAGNTPCGGGNVSISGGSGTSGGVYGTIFMQLYGGDIHLGSTDRTSITNIFGSLRLVGMTTTQRDAMPMIQSGTLIHNTTTNKLQWYNGSAWETITSAP